MGKGLDNIEIERLMKNELHFRGVYPLDLLPKKINLSESGIINLDKSTSPGSHWVCYYNDNNYKFVEYFDPFGEYKIGEIRLNRNIIPTEIVKYLKSGKKKEINYNSSFLQKVDSVKCGHYCIKYIKMRSKGLNPIEVLYTFTQEPSNFNESFVKK